MKRLAILVLLLFLPVTVEAQRIKKHGALVDVNSSGDIIVTPRSGRTVIVTGSLSTTGGVTQTSGTFTGQVTTTRDPANSTNTSASLLVNPATSAANEPLLGVLDNGTTRFLVDKEGDTSTAGNATITGTLGVTGALSGTSGTFSTTLGVTGVTTTTGGLSVGAGNGTLLRLATGTASLDFTALAASTCETLTIPVTNSTTGSSVSLGLPDALVDVDGATESTLFTAWVSANGTVSVRRCNVTAVVTADPDAATVRATVLVF